MQVILDPAVAIRFAPWWELATHTAMSGHSAVPNWASTLSFWLLAAFLAIHCVCGNEGESAYLWHYRHHAQGAGSGLAG